MPARKRAAARVTTGTGDRGDTALFGRQRVPKTDARIEALGDLDEAQSALGVARAQAFGNASALILELQRGLYVVMSEVATPEAERKRLPQRLDATAIATLEERTAALRATTDIEGVFVVPGEDSVSAALDLARAVVRRAERRVVGLANADLVDGRHLVPWLNRLSDLLFVLARSVERSPTRARTDAGSGRDR